MNSKGNPKNETSYSSLEDFYGSTELDDKIKDIMKLIDPLFVKLYEGKVWDYLDENVMSGCYYDTIIKRSKEWANPQKCMYPTCTKNTVKRSHSIQKATSIKYLAENGHVLTPYLDERPKTLEYSMRAIGINDASTFPGFCKEHERIFESFEREGRFEDENDYKLQVFRTICREMAFQNHKLNWLEESYKVYMKQVNNLFVETLQRHYKKKISEIGIKNIEFDSNDNNKKLHLISVNNIKNTLHMLEILMVSYKEDDLFHVTVEIPFQIPVAISGISYNMLLNMKNNNQEEGILVFNCLPYKDTTTIILSGSGEYKESIIELAEYRTQSPLHILNFVESFMVNGTENWFIKKTVWDNLNGLKKRQILNDMFYSEWNINSDYQYSIFDEIRKQLIEECENEIDKNTASKSLMDYLKAEKLKLEQIPQHINETIIDLMHKAANKRLEEYNL